MKLRELFGGIEIVSIKGNLDVDIADIASDSRKVRNGSLFCCLGGSKVDGHRFARDAVMAGAVAVLCEHDIPNLKGATQVVVKDVRFALARISSAFFDHPSEKLTVVGITGTNGKTTTCHLVRSILVASGKRVGLMGTLGHWIAGDLIRDVYTTPESQQVQQNLDKMVKGGEGFCVMEVSSHAIALRRVDCVDFNVVAFTNLTRDHLDFHNSFEEYRNTKMQLFGIGCDDHGFGQSRIAVVNFADQTGKMIALKTPLRCMTYGFGVQADVMGEILNADWHSTSVGVRYRGNGCILTSSLKGRFNAENMLTAYAIAKVLGIDDKTIAKAISEFKSPAGRMETMVLKGRIVIVDYAHTPDALERLLRDVREMVSGTLICVFGCGGDRDKTKRPEMGRIAASLSDITIVTSDNPRTEDPDAIIRDIVKGIPDHARFIVEEKRDLAINKAIKFSKAGDVIVVAGKGHEDYQIVGTERIHFDDREVLKAAFEASDV
ncbi:MAG: UDP-N-acetylmuramoyl-L-alanyl-D-glutamate--2,6-diaminopimelate ligase [bacterium]